MGVSVCVCVCVCVRKAPGVREGKEKCPVCVCVRKAPGVREGKEKCPVHIFPHMHTSFIHITQKTGKYAVYGQHSPGRHGVVGEEGMSTSAGI